MVVVGPIERDHEPIQPVQKDDSTEDDAVLIRQITTLAGTSTPTIINTPNTIAAAESTRITYHIASIHRSSAPTPGKAPGREAGTPVLPPR